MVRYLTQNPHVLLYRPDNTVSRRLFLRKTRNDLVFQTPEGKESFLTATAKDFTFFADNFAVSNGGVGNLKYYYKEGA